MGEKLLKTKELCERWQCSPDVVSKHIQKGLKAIPLSAREQEANFINESNLYKCIFQSRKANAEKFTDWVTSEVLPSIRKHGAYMTDNALAQAYNDPDFAIGLIKKLKEEKEQRIMLQNKVNQDKPKVLFADCVAGSKTSILVRDLAKILRQNGLDIGQNRLYDKLREKGYIMKNSNQPTQKAMELGLFELKEGHYINSIGASVTTITPKVTGKGQIYFINKFINEMED